MANRKISHNSLVSISYEQIEKENDELFMDSLAKLDPDLWLIKSYLVSNGINPAIIPPIIDQLARLEEGSGWGTVTLVIREHRVVKCQGMDDRLVNLAVGDIE